MGDMQSQQGASIIAVIFLIVVVAFLGVIIVSLYVTQSSQAIGELHSTQALYIADGGVEYALKDPSGKGFPNYSYPLYSTRGATPNIVLGQGNFITNSPAVLTAAIPQTPQAGQPINVSIWTSSSDFTPPAANAGVVIETGGNRDELLCTGPNSTASLQGCSKIPAGLIRVHNVDDAVYPITTLSGVGVQITGANCNSLASINVSYDTAMFLPQGILKIDSEYFHYTGKTANSFTNVTRCFRGSSNQPHNGGSVVYQYVITSTGTVSTIFGGNAQRVVRVTVD